MGSVGRRVGDEVREDERPLRRRQRGDRCEDDGTDLPHAAHTSGGTGAVRSIRTTPRIGFAVEWLSSSRVSWPLAPSCATSSFATVYLPVPGQPVSEKTYDAAIAGNCKGDRGTREVAREHDRCCAPIHGLTCQSPLAQLSITSVAGGHRQGTRDVDEARGRTSAGKSAARGRCTGNRRRHVRHRDRGSPERGPVRGDHADAGAGCGCVHGCVDGGDELRVERTVGGGRVAGAGSVRAVRPVVS